MRGVVVIALVAACGRIGFSTTDPQVGDAATDTRSIDGPQSTLAFVQANASDNDGQLQIAASLPSPVVAGDLLVVAVDYDASFLPVIDDDLHCGWNLLPAFQGNGGFDRNVVAWAIAASSGDDVVRATIPSATTYLEMRVHEYAGSATFDNQVGATASTAPAHATITTAAPHSLVFAVVVFNTTAAATAGPSFTQRDSFDDDYSGDAIFAAPGTYAVDAEFTGTAPWTLTAVAFTPM